MLEPDGERGARYAVVGRHQMYPGRELSSAGSRHSRRSRQRRRAPLGVAVGESEAAQPLRVAGGEDLADRTTGVVAHQVDCWQRQLVANADSRPARPVSERS